MKEGLGRTIELPHLFGAEMHEDPYPVYRKLRETDPVHWEESLMGRPRTLTEVAARSDDLTTFGHELAEFLDEFYRERREEMLEEEPARLAGRMGEGDVADAYLAATAVALARLIGARPPR